MDDDDSLTFCMIVAVCLLASFATIDILKIQPLSYIVLLLIISELIHLQIITLSSYDDLKNIKTENDLINKTTEIKFFSIFLSAIAIPALMITLFIIYIIILSTRQIILLMTVLIAVSLIVGAYIYINSIPLRMRKKSLDQKAKKKNERQDASMV